MRERDGARRQASVRVDGAKRLRRSRWERGTCDRVAQGRFRPEVGAGGCPRESDDPGHGGYAKGWRFFAAAGIMWYISEPGTLKKHESLSARAGSVRDVDSGNGGSERAGPPSGGPVRSGLIDVLPGSCPTDLHYGKKGYVQSNKKLEGQGAGRLSGPSADSLQCRCQ